MNESAVVQAKLTELARLIQQKLLPHRPGFALLVFTENGGDVPQTEYVSNLGHAELLSALLQFVTVTAQQPGEAAGADPVNRNGTDGEEASNEDAAHDASGV